MNKYKIQFTLRSMLIRVSNPKIASLAARLVEPNRRPRHEDEEEDDEALFAELEEEIENDSNAEMREYGLQVLRQQWARF
ncbi:hypothetical protein B0H19DRAFT_1179211 [Mycena capillaripes]|nr:hypothetical protein B0H19DRAFT_1179211 [Mycena capillaripes]